METIRLGSAEAIREAALELFARNPGTSLAEVAARAGVGRATLHRHFPSRDALMRDLAIAALDATDAALADLSDEPDARVALARMFERLVPLAHAYHFLGHRFVDDAEVERRYEEQIGQLAELIHGLREQGELDPAVPDAWAVALASALIWTTWSEVAEGRIAEQDAGPLAMRTFVRGLGVEGRGERAPRRRRKSGGAR